MALGLGAAGAALLLVQYVAVRELGSTFFSTELVLLAAVTLSLIGPSVGYALSPRLRRARPAWLACWGLLALVIQLALPVAVRAAVGTIGPLAAAVAATGIVALCGFYAVLLPQRVSATAPLPVLYFAELSGALLALALIRLLPSWHGLLAAYFATAAVTAHGLWQRRWVTMAAAAAAVAAWALYPRLDAAATRQYLRGSRGHRAPVMIATEYSPYQRIDIVDEPAPPGELAPQRTLYLDGVPFYRRGELAAFPRMLAELPGALTRPSLPVGTAAPSALVLGSGSFSSAAHLVRLGYRVTVVELDEAVARLGLRHFADVHQLSPGQVRLVIADARRFLAQTPERFALIVSDVPAPYHLQAALLHTEAFFRQVASRLAPGGVAAISLCDELEGPVGRAVAASAAAAFDEVLVVESASVGFGVVYAAGAGGLPFSVDAAEAGLRARDPQGGRLLDDAAVRRGLLGVEPLSERNLIGVLALVRATLPGVSPEAP